MVVDVVVCEAEFEVVDVEIEAAEHDAYGWIDEAGIRGGDELVVGLFEVTAVGRVGAAEVGDAFGSEFGFNAGFAEDEDFVFVGGEFQDSGNVDGGAIGGAEDVFDGGGDVEAGELFEVFGTGFRGVVGYENCFFAWKG